MMDERPRAAKRRQNLTQRKPWESESKNRAGPGGATERPVDNRLSPLRG